MGFSYPTRFREEACGRLLGGERVEELADELEVPAATLYRWKLQALIDAGRNLGMKSYESDKLQRARRRIRELDSEIATVKAASALFNGDQPIRPQGSAQSLGD